MINAKQLKAIAGFVDKTWPERAHVFIDLDNRVLSACSGLEVVMIKNVSGFSGKGKRLVPLDVVLSAIVLLGKTRFVTADDEYFCGIPYVSLPPELISEHEKVFEDKVLKGCPGLYPSGRMKKLESLISAFRGPHFFSIPASADKPLVLEIAVNENEEKPEGAENWEPPTETVKVAIMPSAFSTMNTFVEPGASK